MTKPTLTAIALALFAFTTGPASAADMKDDHGMSGTMKKETMEMKDSMDKGMKDEGMGMKDETMEKKDSMDHGMKDEAMEKGMKKGMDEGMKKGM